ncbi:TetR/AcrR family transcriptional regulator [Vitiosangium sp. GDMCC 1.1324]|uniref:TetR/AcrR family transcriptional regulator n=1 Tax=Vitiosangium sp. (strain GDMCC 1.1324) TaxID=2138576 RepID=UPI000D368318|nr:TetR/AcrR family transcriptional regulator [Vitiosangium sp. GDMCC 1.1324]PTL83697.1 TetR/AcrR family transcriptional regulator [Vitiosangium sp. GDMCC 1.1324]
MRSLPRSRLQAQKATLPGTVPEGTRRRILEAALRLFASQGFHGTSIRDVAKELGLQPSALYTHFPTKEHILAELVQVGHETLHEALRKALLDAGTEPAAQVRALIRAHTVLHATHPQLAVVVNEELHALPPELAAPAMALRHQSSALLLEVIERGVAMGRFSPPHVVATAAAISAMGVRIPYWYEPADTLDAESLAEIHTELALRMLEGR